MLKSAYIHAFKSQNIIYTFTYSGMHALKSAKVLEAVRPVWFEIRNKMLLTQEMVPLISSKRHETLNGNIYSLL